MIVVVTPPLWKGVKNMSICKVQSTHKSVCLWSVNCGKGRERATERGEEMVVGWGDGGKRRKKGGGEGGWQRKEGDVGLRAGGPLRHRWISPRRYVARNVFTSFVRMFSLLPVFSIPVRPCTCKYIIRNSRIRGSLEWWTLNSLKVIKRASVC